MPIKTKATAKDRATLQTYFTKKAGQMPTKSEWFTVLDSAVNVKDDMNLMQEDIDGLTDALAKKLEKDDLPKTPTAEETFNSMKANIEALIAEKTKDIAAAAAKSYVPALTDMLTDTEPVGRIAQYIGEDDDFNRLYPGYFYKKIREHNPDGDDNGSAPTQDGSSIHIDAQQVYNIHGETYTGNYQTQDANTADKRVQAYEINDRYLVYCVEQSALYNADAPTFSQSDKSLAVFPIAYDSVDGKFVTASVEPYQYNPNIPAQNKLFVNGEIATSIRSTACFANIVIRQSDGKPFRMLYRSTTLYTAGILIPMYADDLYDIAADEETYFSPATLDGNFRGESIMEATTITPRLPIRGTSDYNTDPVWKMIQVSPFILED